MISREDRQGEAMKVLVIVDGREALKLGKDEFGRREVRVKSADIPKGLEEFLEVDSLEMEIMRPVRCIKGYTICYPPIGEATLESLIVLLRAAQAAKQEFIWQEERLAAKTAEENKQYEQEARIASEKIEKMNPADIANMPGGRWVSRYFTGIYEGSRMGGCPVPVDRLSCGVSRLSAKAKEVLLKAMDICDSKEKQLQAERDAAQKQAIEARRKQFAEIVSRLGTDVQKRKWAAGYMRASEVIALRFDELAKPFREAGFKVVDESMWINGGKEENRNFREEERTKLTDYLFSAFEKIKGIAPKDADIKPFAEIFSRTDEGGDERETICQPFFKVKWVDGSLVMEMSVVPPDEKEKEETDV